MSIDPLYNSSVPPIQPTPGPDGNKPMVGAGEEAQPSPFSLPPTAPDKQGSQQAAKGTQKPTPMDMIREGEQQQGRPQWTQEQMAAQINKLQQTFAKTENKLSDPQTLQKFSSDHYKALNMLVDELTPNMNDVSQATQGKKLTDLMQGFNTKNKQKVTDALADSDATPESQSLLIKALNWLGASQGALSQSLNSMGAINQNDPTSYLKIQLSVQRAVQRGELFASIIGSSVSGIKTLMSTQLG